jgi:hypothetical protein
MPLGTGDPQARAHAARNPWVQVERVRTLYGKFVEWDPTHVAAWVMFADLEASLQEEERARAIYELALSQPVLNQPERLWMQYIDFEIGLGERGNARALYERLLERTQHVKARRRLLHRPQLHVDDHPVCRRAGRALLACRRSRIMAGEISVTRTVANCCYTVCVWFRLAQHKRPGDSA